MRLGHDGDNALAFPHQGQHAILLGSRLRQHLENGLFDGGVASVHVAEMGDLFQGGNDVVLGAGAALEEKLAEQASAFLLVIEGRLEGFKGDTLAVAKNLT